MLNRLNSPKFWMAIVLFFVTGIAFAESSSGVSGIGYIAANITNNLGQVALLITAASYVGGMAFAVGAIAKFKQHKDNPTQIPLSTPVVLLFVGIALIFAPSIFQAGGGTLFGSKGSVSEVSGTTTFGASKAK